MQGLLALAQVILTLESQAIVHIVVLGLFVVVDKQCTMELVQ